MVDLAQVRHEQPRAAGLLCRLAGNPPPLVLLEGGEETSRRHAALFWVAALHCQEASRPCGQCAPCRMVLADASRDLLWLRGDEGEIKVGDARAVRQWAMDPPLQASWRVVLVTEAQAMNVEAQNALLKILEEPVPATVFCLTVPHRDTVLPTVVSRAFPLTLSRRVSSALDPDTAAWLGALAEFMATGGGDFLTRTAQGVEAPTAQALVLEVMRSLLGVMRGEPRGPLADVLTRRADVVSARQAQVAAQQALERLRLGVTPALVLESLAMTLWRLFS